MALKTRDPGRRWRGIAAAAIGILVAGIAFGQSDAAAQGWWPWANQDRPPPPPRAPAPIPAPQPVPPPDGAMPEELPMASRPQRAMPAKKR